MYKITLKNDKKMKVDYQLKNSYWQLKIEQTNKVSGG